MSRVRVLSRTRRLSTGGHWLPSSARAWLEKVENAAFTRALTDAMKKIPQISGREEAIANAITSSAAEIYDDAYRGTDAPSDAAATHAKAAARTIATYQQLRPYLGSDEATMNIIRTHLGSERTAQTMNGGLIKGALMLSRDKVATLAGMLGNITNDLAPGAWTREDVRRVVSFTTCSCTYHAFFKKYDMEFLTQTTCCSLDVDVWFSNVDPTTASVTLEESLARGDPQCRVVVRPGNPY